MSSFPHEIEVVPYDPQWPEFYETESIKLSKTLGDNLKRVYHIGSTSIPDLHAKPIIDMILVMESLDNLSTLENKLMTLKYSTLGKMIIPHRSFLSTKNEGPLGFNLHIYERGDPQINRHVNFRNYLRQHPQDALDYQQLKTSLAQKASTRYEYVLGKDTLVQALDRKAKLWASKQKNDYLSPNSGPKASQWTQDKIKQCMEANLNVHLTYYAQFIDSVTLTRIPDYTAINTHLNDDTFNVILRADFDENSAATTIQKASESFTSEHTPFSWWVCDTDQPKNLRALLEDKGYHNAENNTAMYLNLESWEPETPLRSELKIIRVHDKKTLLDFAMVLYNDKESFYKYFCEVAEVMSEEDPIEYYVGYVAGKPVVRGLSCYYAQTVGLHWLSTCPTERRKGYGIAMQEFRLMRAKELGYSIAVLQASHEGYPLYKKLGYETCGTYQEFKIKNDKA